MLAAFTNGRSPTRPEVEAAPSAASRRELDRLARVVGKPQRAREVVRRPHRDDAERDAARASRHRRRSRSTRRPRRRSRARGRPRRPRRHGRGRSGRPRDRGHAAPARPRPPRPTRNPGWRAERSRGQLRWASSSGPRGPWRRSCWRPCARSRTASRPDRRPCRAASPAAPWPAPRVLSTPFCGHHEARGSRNARIARTMHTATITAMVKRAPFPGYRFVAEVPGRAGAKTGHNPRAWIRGSRSTPTSASSGAPGCRCSSRAFPRPRTSSTARRPCSGWSSSASCWAPGSLIGRWWQNLLAIAGAVAFVCAGDRGRQHDPGAPGARDPAADRQDRARGLRDPPRAPAADLRRPGGQRRDHDRRQPAPAGADLRGLRLRAAGDPALGLRQARGPAALVARAARQRRAAACDLRPAVVCEPGDVADLRHAERLRLRLHGRPLRRSSAAGFSPPRAGRDPAPGA